MKKIDKTKVKKDIKKFLKEVNRDIKKWKGGGKKMEPQIKKTNNYSVFTFVKGNREILPAHLKNLTASIAKKNLLSYNPILVNKQMQVIDGQHRLEVAKTNGWPIYYIQIDEPSGFEDVVLLNANEQNWLMVEYLNAYCQKGNEDYIKLAGFVNKFNLPIGLSASLIAGYAHRSRGLMKKFKEGKFKATQYEKAVDLIHRLLEIKPFTTGDTMWKNRDFVQALLAAYRKIRHQTLMKRLHNYLEKKGKLIPQPTYRDTILMLEDVYNYRRSVRTRFY